MADYDDLLDSPKDKKQDRSSFNYRDEIDFDNSTKQLKDKVTSIRNFLDEFQKKLEGYEYLTSTEKITYTGRVLCSSEVIQKLVSMLSPFCENANLIGEVEIQDYYRVKHEWCSSVNAMLLVDMGVPVQNQTTILKMFKATFKKIGNIVNSSRDLMKGQFMMQDQGDKGGIDI